MSNDSAKAQAGGLLENLQADVAAAVSAVVGIKQELNPQRIREIETQVAGLRTHVDGLRFIVSNGRVGAKDETLGDSPVPTPPAPTPTTPTPTPPAPTPPGPTKRVYAIVDFKLTVNGVALEDTFDVVQLGTLDGYDNVHMNSGKDWYGTNASGNWVYLNRYGVTPIGTPLVIPKVPTPDPTPIEDTGVLSIIDGQLAIDGLVQTDTSNVVQLGKAAGYVKVHLNTRNEWYGVNAKGQWSLVPTANVTPVGPRIEIKVTAPEISGDKAIWARKYPKASTKYVRGNPPGKILRTLYNHTEDPLWIDPNFAGNHIQTGVPKWIRDGQPQAAIIPAPTYKYGYSRSLHANGNEADDPTFWWQVERVKGQYYWNDFDAWMKVAGDHPVIINLYGTPTFYQKYPGERSKWPNWHGLASPPTDGEGMRAYERFARAVIDRYGKKIVGLENWNEPNFWGTQSNSRWSPSVTNSNGAPFFSGTPVDLAKMQVATYNATKGTSTLAMSPAFTDEYKSSGSQMEVFLNTETGVGQAKKYVEAACVHHYDYDVSTDALSNMLGYRELLKRVGLNVDLWNTEIGAEVRAVFNNETAATRAPKRITYWGFVMAALGFRSAIFYGHLNAASRLKHLGDPVGVQPVIQALNLVHSIGGKSLREAAALVDGRIWLRFDDNTEVTSL